MIVVISALPNGDPGGTRTPYLQIRNIFLYHHTMIIFIWNQYVIKLLVFETTKYGIYFLFTFFDFYILIFVWNPIINIMMIMSISEVMVE